MRQQVLIQTDFPNVLQEKLLRKVCLKRDRRAVHVSHLNRFGFSGAELLLLHFDSKPTGLPFLLKMAELSDIRREYNATQILEDDLREAQLVEDCIFEASDSERNLGALLFVHQGTTDPLEAHNPKALKDVVYKRDISDAKVKSIVKSVYGRLRNAHLRHQAKRVQLRHHFKSYFRKDRASAPIRKVLGPYADTERFEFLDAKIFNPLKYLKTLPEYATLSVASVHGDLHPSNIIVDSEGTPRLIDFAWAHRSRDVLVDFVLLENSLRFMTFPRPINLRDHLMVDKYLLLEEGTADISLRHLSSPENKPHYVRLVNAVSTIRHQARTLLGSVFSMDQYLLTQFILLYGLLAHDTYEPYVSTRALGLIAMNLKTRGLSA